MQSVSGQRGTEQCILGTGNCMNLSRRNPIDWNYKKIRGIRLLYIIRLTHTCTQATHRRHLAMRSSNPSPFISPPSEQLCKMQNRVVVRQVQSLLSLKSQVRRFFYFLAQFTILLQIARKGAFAHIIIFLILFIQTLRNPSRERNRCRPYQAGSTCWQFRDMFLLRASRFSLPANRICNL